MFDSRLQKLLEPSIMTLGYELLGVERLSQGRQSTLLRLYIDSPDGINVADCGRVSHQVSGVLEVEEPIAGNYTLEVSSPGLDRPLVKLAHFEEFTGQRIKLRTLRPINGQRNFTGRLLAVEDQELILEIDYNKTKKAQTDKEPDATLVRIAFSSVEKANVIADLS